jgi:hypothetical protein
MTKKYRKHEPIFVGQKIGLLTVKQLNSSKALLKELCP